MSAPPRRPGSQLARLIIRNARNGSPRELHANLRSRSRSPTLAWVARIPGRHHSSQSVTLQKTNVAPRQDMHNIPKLSRRTLWKSLRRSSQREECTCRQATIVLTEHAKKPSTSHTRLEGWWTIPSSRVPSPPPCHPIASPTGSLVDGARQATKQTHQPSL